MTISLDNVGSGFKRSVINDNFDTIESEINTNVLTKDGGKALTADLDFNGNDLLNVKSISATELNLNGVLISEQGTKGADGEQGDVGSIGPTGARGPTGPAGNVTNDQLDLAMQRQSNTSFSSYYTASSGTVNNKTMDLGSVVVSGWSKLEQIAQNRFDLIQNTSTYNFGAI
jgi:hypothetical protein